MASLQCVYFGEVPLDGMVVDHCLFKLCRWDFIVAELVLVVHELVDTSNLLYNSILSTTVWTYSYLTPHRLAPEPQDEILARDDILALHGSS